MKNLFGEVAEPPKRNGKTEALGCSACTLNDVEGVRKIINIDRIRGRKLFVWAQGPGKVENERGLELVGPSGQFLWRELAEVGITREMCDVQNCCRCQPITSEDGNTPTKHQLKCCSVYNVQALEKSRANVHLILGKVAATQLLGKRASAKASFWHEEWNAHVVVADHPARLLRSGGRKAGWLYDHFRARMNAVRVLLDHPGRDGFVDAQDYGVVTTPTEMVALGKEIYAEAQAGNRVSVDIEDGDVDGKREILIVGFGLREGYARAVVLKHPGAPQTEGRLTPLLRMLKRVLEDPKVRKAFQYGSSDVIKLKSLGINVRGYDFDTQYSSYLWRPHLRAYGLAALAGYFFPEFGEYKSTVAEWWPNRLADCPLETLVKYNGMDCDLTKRIEALTADKMSWALLQVYVNAAFTLAEMEERGPLYDTTAHDKLAEVIRPRVKKLWQSLCQAAGNQEFNPNTPQEVAALLFDKLGFPEVNGRSTVKAVVETFLAKTKSKVPQMVLDYRELSKLESTYLNGYKRSAELHGGELRTRWHLTGTVTGRLSSGGKEEGGLINLQNITGDAALKLCIVSDPDWREALEN